MKTLSKVILSLSIALIVALPTISIGKGKGKAPKQAFDKIQEETISAVSANSITVTHTRNAAASAGKDAEKETINKTYQLSPMTDIEVNGQTGTAADLKVGMAVQVSADPPSGLDAPDPTAGGTARAILAHDTAH